MKTSTLAGEGSFTVSKEIDILKGWRLLLEKLSEFFSGTFESDWEKKTGLIWQEWGKFPYMQ